MPKFNRNNRTSDLSAVVSNSVVITTWHGRTVISKKPPPPKRKYNSPKQQESIDRFRDGHNYADRILKSDEKKAFYAKGINAQKTSAHTVAFQDYLSPPVVHYIRLPRYTGKAGDIITVKATDDFHVDAVQIEIFDRKGTLLERGNAERYRRKPFIWKYKTTVANENFKGSTIQATATDMPGNGCVMTAKIGEERTLSS
jgi:hypothetical protein